MALPADRSRWTADAAVEELYAAHYRSLVRLSVLLVADVGTAEEVVQDCFVSMHGRWRSLREPEKALAYLRQAVVNRSRSVLRRRATAARLSAGTPPSEAADLPDAEHDVLLSEHRSAVLQALRRLPDRQREVLALRYYLDLSEAEIAEALGISKGSVKTHAARGAAALRVSMEDVR